MWRSLLLFGSNCSQNALKTRKIRSSKNSDFLCFQVLLSFVPTIFHFLKFPAFSPRPGHPVFFGLPVVAQRAYDNVSPE